MDDDPRLTVVLTSWVLAPRWLGSGAMRLWGVVFTRLAALRDARAIIPLRSAANALPPFVGAGHRKKMAEARARAADAVEAACRTVPKDSKSRDDDLAELESLLEQPAADFFAPKRTGASASTLDLMKRVWDHPDDDDVRRVTADALLEAGDPWGELITLQMSTGAKQGVVAKRIATLIQKHGSVVCGPIGKIAKVTTRVFDKGFLVECTTNASMKGRSEWEPAATCPHWATVQRVHFDMSETPLWWLTEWARSAATQKVAWMEICRWRQSKLVLERSPSGAISVTKIGSGATDYQSAFQKLVAGFPAEERARIAIPNHPTAPTFRAMLAPGCRDINER
jgi:uncharacterized protein (TIGR02996 family)